MTRFLAAGVRVPHPCDPTMVGATSRRSSDARDDHTATAPHRGCGVALLSTQSRSCVQGITGDREPTIAGTGVYPGEWLFCVRCLGRGYVQAQFGSARMLGMPSVPIVCPSCAGRGRRKAIAGDRDTETGAA